MEKVDVRNPGWLAVYWAPVLVGAGFAACSFGVYPLMEAFNPGETGALFVYTCFGVIGASAALLAIGSVLCPVSYWLRTLTSFSVGLVLFGFWVIGFYVSRAGGNRLNASDEWRTIAIVLLCLPLVFLAIQSPLWLVRLACRWDVTVSNPPKPRQVLPPLTIRDMLAAMGLIGFGLGGARFAMQLAEQSSASSEAEFWFRTGVAIASCFGISLASTLPVVVATLRAKQPALALLGICAYVAIALAVTLIIIGVFDRRAPRPWNIVGMSTTAAAFAASMAAPLMMARRRGYRLRWGRESVVGYDQRP